MKLSECHELPEGEGPRMKLQAVIFLLAFITVLPLSAKESETKPLVATGQIVSAALTGRTAAFEQAVRASVTLTNSTPQTIRGVHLVGHFLGADDKELHEDETSLDVKRKSEETGFLYFSNPSRLHVTKIVVEMSYEIDGESKKESFTIERSFVEPVQYNK